MHYTEDPESLALCVGAVALADLLLLCWVCIREKEREREDKQRYSPV